MTTGLPTHEMKIPLLIMEMERELQKLKWWQFLQRHNLNQRILYYRGIGWEIGISLALDDLEKAGKIIRKK